MIGCRRWRPSWSHRVGRDRRAGGPPRHWRPRRRPRRYRSSSRPRRPGQAWSRRQPRPAGWQHDRSQFLEHRARSKRLELLLDLVPTSAAIGVLVDPTNPNTEFETADMWRGGRSRRLQHVDGASQHRSEIDAAFASLGAERPDALFVAAQAFFTQPLTIRFLPDAAARVAHDLSIREFVVAGGLMSYGASITGRISPGRHLHRPHSQGREAGRSAGACSRPSSSWSSISRPPRRSASTCRTTLLALADEVIE